MPETYAEIDLDALVHNINQMSALLGRSQTLAVLKANAYGLGAPEVFKALCGAGVKRFATANFYEAMELRKLDAEAWILVLGYVAPQNIAAAAENRLALTVFSEEYWQSVEQNATHPLDVHIKVNTGFNRLGFDDNERAHDCVSKIAKSQFARIEGIYSHFALTDPDEDKLQMTRFLAFASEAERRGASFKIKHIADSISAVAYDWARLDMSRLGAVMYGLKAARPEYNALDLRPAMRLCSTVTQVRTVKKGEGVSYDYIFKAPQDMKVATMCFGYADGPSRRLGGTGHVVINGQKAPIIGLICMDQCMADISGIDGVKPGDKAVVFDFDERSPASIYDMATLLQTNKNAIAAAVSRRVSRVYRQNGCEWTINGLLHGGS